MIIDGNYSCDGKAKLLASITIDFKMIIIWWFGPVILIMDFIIIIYQSWKLFLLP